MTKSPSLRGSSPSRLAFEDLRARKAPPRIDQLEERLVPAISVTDLTTLTPSNLVQDLTGNGVTFSNVQYTGAKGAAGIFTGGQSAIGFDSGVVLSTGSAAGIVGPNNTDSFSVDNGTPGDADLDKIVAPNTTQDAAVLQFDIKATGNVLAFQYVFGSEEYDEFVNSGFNDVFAFYVNGQNVALLPGTNTPVSIDNVNNMTNSQFFVDNPVGSGVRDTQLDGLTTVLPVVLPVTPGQTYHIKLAIADVGDGAYDSDVMIKAGSLSTPSVKALGPLRYIYDKNTGVASGNVYISSNQTIPGPVFLEVGNLPPGVTLQNATGTSPSGKPYIQLSSGDLPANEPIKLNFKVTNPQKSSLNTFYLGFDYEVTGILT